jgi:hypothetical protein
MATITTRAGKGSPLTNDEVDANFTNLNTDKAETDGATLTNVDINSGTIDGTTIGGASAGAITGTTITGTSFVSSGDMTFGDNDKAIFGAGSDLQIYHDGSNSNIKDAGTGPLKIFATDLYVNNSAGSKTHLSGIDGGAVTLHYNGSAKLATTNTGIDVTGTVTADGLTSSEDIYVSMIDPELRLLNTGSAGGEWRLLGSEAVGATASFRIYQNGVGNRFKVADNGDISFYEDTGTTPKFFWDASTERLGIGNVAPATALDVTGTVTADGLTVDGTALFLDGTFTTGSTPTITLGDSATYFKVLYGSNAAIGGYTGVDIFGTASGNKIATFANGGDISFYEDTGVTPKLFWDASEEGLNIGASSAPFGKLDISDVGGTGVSTIFDGASGDNYITSGSSGIVQFRRGATNTVKIDGSGNVGIGTSSPSQKLDVVGSILGSQSISIGTGGLYQAGSIYSDSNWGMIFRAKQASPITAEFMWANSADTERMRIDSGGDISFRDTSANQAFYWDASAASLGIGTTSPGVKLEVSGAAANAAITGSITNTDASGYSVLRLRNTGTSGKEYQVAVGGPTSALVDNFYIYDASAAAVRLTLTSSGNLGLGVTPSAWYSGASTLQMKNGAVVAFSGIDGSVSTNAYYDTSWKYYGTGASTFYNQNAGIHSWHTAPSGTAGNPITFTQAMTLDASGNLLVGQTTTGSYEDGRVATTSTGTASSFKTTTVGAACSINWNSATSGDNVFKYFVTETSPSVRGSIDYNRAGGLTRYNTTSDYRAKDIIGPVQNVGETIDALKVYEGVMKGATQSRPMLVAHEAQEYAPYAVTGVKDEVDENGTPKFQQMDVSSLVPLLLAEIQDLRKRIAILESN